MSMKRILGVMLASRLAGRGRGRGGLGTAGALALGSRRGGLGRKMGIAGLGYMAWRAYQDHQSRQPSTTQAGGATHSAGGGGLGGMIRGVADRVAGMVDPDPQSPEVQDGARAADGVSEDEARLLIQAMVAAAYADGELSQDERARILAQVDEAGGDAEDRRAMERELANPKPIDTLLANVQGEEMAEEFYLASCAAIDPDTPRNRSYLDTLRGRLGLSAADAEEIEALA